MKSFKSTDWNSYHAKYLCEFTGKKDPISGVIYLARKSAQKVIDIKKNPPYLPEDFIRVYEKIEVRDEKNLKCDARLVPTNDGYIIEIREDIKRTNRGRYNFCFYHEIAHTFFIECESMFLNRKKTKFKQCKVDIMTEIKEEELLCDIAAAEFLMPEEQFRRDANDYKPNFESLKKISNLYVTSYSAIVKRLEFLKAWDCLFVKTTPFDYSNLEKGYNVSWNHHIDYTLRGKIQLKELVDCLRNTLQCLQNKADLGIIQTFKEGIHTSRVVSVPWKNLEIRIESEKFSNNDSQYVLSMLTLND